jgi:hypothetical protein
MNPQPFWCIAVLNKLPEDIFKEGIILQEGFAEDTEDDPEEVQYMILLRTKSFTEEDAKRMIRVMLKDFGFNLPEEIITLSVKLEDSNESEQESVAKLEEGDVSTKNRFVGLKRNCLAAREQAISMIEMAVARE